MSCSVQMSILLKIFPHSYIQERTIDNWWLVIGNHTSIQHILRSNTFAINQKIILFDTNHQTLMEVYNINNQTVSKLLAQISNGTFQKDENGHKGFIERRSNFYGLKLRASIMWKWWPLTYVQNENHSVFDFEENGNGDLVANADGIEFFGVFPAILELLEESLNFTTQRQVRRDDSEGYPIVKNGSMVGWSGMTGDLLSGKTDLIAAPILDSIDRYGYVRFTHSMDTLTSALFVSAKAGQEDREWLTYFLPFHTTLWYTLILNSIVAMLAVRFVDLLITRQWSTLTKAQDYVSDTWMVFSSYFGKPSTSDFLWSSYSVKVLLFIIFLSGNIVFMAYKASLTSELSVTNHVLPFDSPKEYYFSKYG
jgi:hypothetical protein